MINTRRLYSSIFEDESKNAKSFECGTYNRNRTKKAFKTPIKSHGA